MSEESIPLGNNEGVVLPLENDEHVDFGSFIISIGHSAYVAMGKVCCPERGSQSVELENAQQFIEILEMLEKKTKGNLEPEESRMLSGLLYELRIAFVELC